MVAAASPLVAVLIPGARVARALERLLALYRGVAVAVQALRALRLLLAVCSGKVEAAVVHIMQAQAVQVVRAVVALAEVAVAQHAVHMPLAPAV